MITCVIPYQQGLGLFQKMPKANDKALDGISIMKNGRIPPTKNSEAAQPVLILSLIAEREIWIMRYSRKWVLQRNVWRIMMPYFFGSCYSRSVIQKDPGYQMTPDYLSTQKSKGGDAANAIVEGKVTLAQLKQAKKVGGRLCGDLTMFQIHKESIETKKYELSCKFCGKLCYTRCGVCQLPCHDAPTRGSCKGYQCFTQLHNEQLFGLAIMDCKLINKDKKDWTPPTPQQKEENAKHIKEIQRKVAYNLRGRATVPDSI